jgi:hypothetical protein
MSFILRRRLYDYDAVRLDHAEHNMTPAFDVSTSSLRKPAAAAAVAGLEPELSAPPRDGARSAQVRDLGAGLLSLTAKPRLKTEALLSGGARIA